MRKFSETNSSTAIQSAIFLFLYVALVTTVTAVLSATKLTNFHLPIPHIAAAVVVIFAYRRKWNVVAISLTIFCAALAMANLFDDVYFDGVTYHASGIVWSSTDFSLWRPVVDDFWNLFVNHYPKASWLWGASFLGPIGNLTFAKSLNWVFLGASGLVAYQCFRNLNRSTRILAALAISFNPIVCNQLFTNYVDGLMGSLLVTALVTSGRLIQLRYKGEMTKQLGVALIFSLIYMPGLKFTGLLFSGAIVVANLVAYSFLYSNANRLSERLRSGISTALFNLKVFWKQAVSALLFAIFLLWNPYITNLSLGLNPLHPAFGDKKLSTLISGQTTQEFYDLQPAHRLFLSLFAKSSELMPTTTPAVPTVKMPFQADLAQIQMFAGVDTRIGGWGPLMSGILLTALLMLLMHFWNLRALSEFSLLSIPFVVVAITLLNPESWWARFSPQVATLPILVVWMLMNTEFPGSPKKQMLKYLGTAILTLSLINTALTTIPMVMNVANANSYLTAQTDTFKSWDPQGRVTWNKHSFNLETIFARRGISWRKVTNDSFDGNYCADLFNERVCSGTVDK